MEAQTPESQKEPRAQGAVAGFFFFFFEFVPVARLRLVGDPAVARGWTHSFLARGPARGYLFYSSFRPGRVRRSSSTSWVLAFSSKVQVWTFPFDVVVACALQFLVSFLFSSFLLCAGDLLGVYGVVLMEQ